MSKDAVRDFSGKIIGWVENDSQGNQIVRSFLGTIVAKYDKKMDVTRSFTGTILTKGNTAVGQLFNPTINKDFK